LQQNILLKDQNEKLNNQLLEQNKFIIGLLEQNNQNKNNIQNNKNIKNQNNGVINNIIIQHGKEDLSKIDDKVSRSVRFTHIYMILFYLFLIIHIKLINYIYIYIIN